MRPQQSVVRVEQLPSATPATPGTAAAPASSEARPLSARDIASLRERRSELSRQLTSAEDRRGRLAESLKGTEGEARLGIIQRMEVLDKRIVQIEEDIAATGRLITNSPLGLSTSTEPASRILGLEEENFMALAGGFGLLVLLPIALAFARLIWKRATTRSPTRDVESDRRLERMEQAIDSIAIEMERVSEHQRFTSRMLSEGAAFPALSAGQRPAEPIPIPVREGVGSSREHG